MFLVWVSLTEQKRVILGERRGFKTDPRRVLARCEKAFIEPSLVWERVGTVPDVIFLEGAMAIGRLIAPKAGRRSACYLFRSWPPRK